jgi:protein SCO1
MSARFVFSSAIAMGLMVLTTIWPKVCRADDDPHAAHRRAMQVQATAGATRVMLPNVVLRDAHDKPFALRADSFEGKVVVVDFIFTTCTTICPVLSDVMATVQRELGDQVGKDVVLVSISVDPVNDSPAVMRAYAKQKGAGHHWRWLTGSTGDIARVLRAFGLSAGKPNDHPPLVLVGDPARNQWQRWVGVPTPKAVVEGARTMVAQSKLASLSSSSPSSTAPAVAVKDPHAHH